MRAHESDDHSSKATPEPVPDRPAGAITALQRSAGNRAVAAALGSTLLTVQRATEDDIKQDEDEAWSAKSIATELKTALLNSTAPGAKPVLSLLSGHSPQTSSRIESAYNAISDGGTLRSTLRWYYDLSGREDDLVKAWALLRHPHYHDYHVAVALALIPAKTRDTELYRLLTAAAKGSNQRVLRSEYDATFHDLGLGSLQADLEGDLKDMELKRANALMDHPLTDAEQLWLNLYGLKDEGVSSLSILERVWKAGPQEFHSMKEDWDYLVVNRNAWSSLTLKQACESKLPGWVDFKDLRIAREIFFAYETWAKHLSEEQLNEYLQKPGEGESKTVPWQEQDWMLQAQILAEERFFKLADPETGEAGDKARYLAALERIQTLNQQRIAQAKAADQLDFAAVLELNWSQTKKNLLASVHEAFDPGSDEYVRARLLAEGNLTLGDKLWMKWKDADAPGIIALTTEAWGKGELDLLIAGCGAPRTVADGLVRPGVPPLVNLVRTGMFGDDGERVHRLVQQGPDVWRGRQRLAYELDPAKGRSDRVVKGAYDFLTTPGIKPDLRNAVIADYTAHHVGDSLGRMAAQFAAGVFLDIELPSNPIEKFLDHLASSYPNSNTVWNFYDLLAPSQDINEIVRRAEQRTLIATTGFSAGLAELFDVGGEDTLATTRESLERLQYLQSQGLGPDDVGLLLAMMGKKTTAELAGVEYDMLKERVDAALAARKAAVGTFVGLVEFAVKVFLTAVTAGAPLIADLGSTLAGIFVQELIEGEESDALTEANLAKLLAPVAGMYVGKLGEEVGEAAFWAKTGAIGPLLKGTTSELIGQAGEKVMDMIFNPKAWPTTDNILAGLATGLVTSLTSAQAGIVADRIKGDIPLTEEYLGRAQRIVQSKMYSNVITQTGGMVVKIGSGGMDGKDLTDVFAEFTEGVTVAQGKSLVGGLAEARASLVKARGQQEDNALTPGAETSVLERGKDAPAFKETEDASKDRHVTLGSGSATVILSDTGDAEIHVDTPYGRQNLRDVVVSVRPPATADQAVRTKWAQLANKVVFLEHRAKDMEQSQIESELFEIALAVVWDLDPSRGTSGAAPLIGR